MVSAVGQYFKRLFGPRKLEVTEDRPTRVSLQFGPTNFVFDKASEQVTKDGTIVAVIPLINEICVYQPGSQASTPLWYVSAKVTGQRSVELGHTHSKEEATHIAGVLAVLTRKPVKAHK